MRLFSKQTVQPILQPAPSKIEFSTVTMDPLEAATEYEKYQAVINKPIDKTTTAVAVAQKQKNVSPNSLEVIDRKLADVYKALSEGATVVNMEETIQKLGCDSRNRPRIAIAYANWRTVVLERNQDGSLVFGETTVSPRLTTFDNIERISGLSIRFPSGTLPRLADPSSGSLRISTDFTTRATVPVIPAGLRPDNLEDFRLVWEPLWFGDRPKIVDPILLRYLGGMLYTIIASWDVTPIEQAILRGL